MGQTEEIIEGLGFLDLSHCYETEESGRREEREGMMKVEEKGENDSEARICTQAGFVRAPSAAVPLPIFFSLVPRVFECCAN
jgi:hypothetical protein